MSTDFNSDVTTLKTNEAKLLDSRGKVARFCYEEQALEGNTDTDVYGVTSYNYNNVQNIPQGTPAILQMSETVLSKGLRSQGSSFTRMGVNHFWGRASYNINKLAKHLNDLIGYFKNFLREGDNAWSPTATYEAGDVVYVMLTKGGKTYKRTFSCTQESTNLAPVDAGGNLTNTSYWEEIGGNVMGDLHVAGEADFTNNVLMEKNLSVRGDLVVEGSTLVTDEQTISTKSDYAVLRQSNPSGLGATEKAGMVVHNYDGSKNAFIGVDQDGIFRVSDNASENTTTYTNKSKYGANFYDGLTQTTASVVSGATVAEDMDELEDCVLEGGTYYHSFNGQWFSVSLVSNKLYFDKTSPITDPTLISTLEAGTKDTLFYYRSISILVVSDSANQPLLTRQEASDLSNDDILRWDSSNQRAKGGLTVADITASATSYKLVNSKTITGISTLSSGSVLPLYFTVDIDGSNVEQTLTLTYNGTPYAVKVNKNGILADFSAQLIGADYKFIQANTAIDFMFAGTYLVVLGNPVVLSSNTYTIYADGQIGVVDVPSAISQSISYSTTETLTGGKWIDGKPIYRKVIETTYGNISSINLGSGLNIIKFDGYIQDNNRRVGIISSGSANEPSIGLIYDKSSGVCSARVQGNYSSSSPIYVIIEYTKTTD